jgi:hypothetical protein
MPIIQAKDAAEATIYLYSTKANSDETPAVSQENLLDALEPQTNTTAPSTDTAAAGINGRLIRLAQRLTSLIGLFPTALGQATMGSSFPVVLASNQSAVSVSGTVSTGLSQPLTDAQLRATAVPIEPLGIPGVARQLSATAASTNTALTSTCRRISITALVDAIRFSIGSSSQTASTTSHFIAAGERLDLALPSTPNIAVLRAGAVNATLEVTEYL